MIFFYSFSSHDDFMIAQHTRIVFVILFVFYSIVSETDRECTRVSITLKQIEIVFNSSADRKMRNFSMFRIVPAVTGHHLASKIFY